MWRLKLAESNFEPPPSPLAYRTRYRKLLCDPNLKRLPINCPSCNKSSRVTHLSAKVSDPADRRVCRFRRGCWWASLAALAACPPHSTFRFRVSISSIFPSSAHWLCVLHLRTLSRVIFVCQPDRFAERFILLFAVSNCTTCFCYDEWFLVFFASGARRETLNKCDTGFRYDALIRETYFLSQIAQLDPRFRCETPIDMDTLVHRFENPFSSVA